MSALSTYLKPAAFIALPHVGGLAGALVTRPQIAKWYRSLNRAPWNPPEWVFGPMWTCLYTGMGYASWLVYKEVGLYSPAMYLYGAQLALNWAWSPLFFGAHRVGLAVLDLLAVLGLAAVCVKEFRPISKPASNLMVPYVMWLSLAMTLNFYVWFNNDSRTLRGDADGQAGKKKK